MIDNDGKNKNDAGNGDGADNTNNAADGKDDPAKHFVSSPVIEAAKAENDRKAELIEEEKKLMARKEKLHAEQMVGGHTVAGGREQAPAQTEEERLKTQGASFFEGTALGDAIKKT